MGRLWRTVLTAFVLALTLALAGCTSSSNDNNLPTGANRSAEPIRPPASDAGISRGGQAPDPSSSATASGESLCDDPELADSNKKVDAFCNGIANDIPWYNASGDKVMTYKIGRIPVSRKYAGRTNVQAYVQDVMRSQRDNWRTYFADTGITVPTFNADVVSGSEKHHTDCPSEPLASSKKLVVTASSPTGVYCHPSQNAHDSIALPESTIGKLWKEHDRGTADLAAAIIASRAGGYMLNTALTRQSMGGSLNTMAGSCLAGVWAHGVYPANKADDLDRALAYARAVPITLIGGQEPDAKALDSAWQIGFAEGKVDSCSDPKQWLQDDLT